MNFNKLPKISIEKSKGIDYEKVIASLRLKIRYLPRSQQKNDWTEEKWYIKLTRIFNQSFCHQAGSRT